MLIFISGGSASGKSALAERVCCALPGEHIYIATMPVRTPSDRKLTAKTITMASTSVLTKSWIDWSTTFGWSET